MIMKIFNKISIMFRGGGNSYNPNELQNLLAYILDTLNVSDQRYFSQTNII